MGRAFSAKAMPNALHGPSLSTDPSHFGIASDGCRRARRHSMIASTTSVRPTRISMVAITVSGRRSERGDGIACAPSVKRETMTAMPSTQPIRNGSAVLAPFGESRMTTVAMIGTELIATASAIGRMCPIASSMRASVPDSGYCSADVSRATPSRKVADAGSLLPLLERELAADRRGSPASTSRISATNDAPRTSSETSKLRLNERMSMLLEPITATSSSIDRCFACRMYGRRVQPDLHAGPQQRPVVRALGVPDRALVADLGDEQLHVEAALAAPR